MRSISLLTTCLLLCLNFFTLSAQELNFSVRINTQKLQTIDPSVFKTLEQTLVDFLNNQKWTNDVYEVQERINCNLLLTIEKEISPTSFEASLAIQSSRPVYGSDYKTAILNHLDKDVVFTYEQYQPLQYSNNSYNDNLSSILAFYVHIILGMDYDTFDELGGTRYYQVAQEILNTVPPDVTNSVPGWRSVENNRNRFWIVENLLSPRIRNLRRALYNYHRLGLDMMSTDVDAARATVAEAVNTLPAINQSYPNAVILQMFVNAKNQEIVEIFKRGTLVEQNQVIQAMTRIDPSNGSRYRSIR